MGIGSKSTSARAPTEKPQFTLSEIKKAIPPHCFQRSLLRSFSYLISDFTAIFILYCVSNIYINQLPKPISYIAWLTYAYLQGCFLTGVWVLAHECGHHSFSDYQWLDDSIGLILHSLVLTPYFSWKHSHRRHHSNPGSMEKDEVYVPKRKTRTSWYQKYLIHPIGRALSIFISLSLGLHMYFSFNMYGRKYDGFASHYNPYAPIYTRNERLQIYISDVGVLTMAYVLLRFVAAKGFAYVMCIYGGPLLVMNGYIVVITLLHHTHASLPHYEASEWDWLRGALATVDRDFGVLNIIFHHISDTHVAHHLFSTIPHYRAVEATKAIKPILGKYYKFDNTPVYKALWREYEECMYVEADEQDENKGVLWYTNKF